MKNEKLDKDFKKKWIAILRNPKTKQCALFYKNHEGAVCVMGAAGQAKFNDAHKGYGALGNSHTTIKWELIDLNDEGVPFEILAGIINEYL